MEIYTIFRLGYGFGGSRAPSVKNKKPGSNTEPGLQKKPDKVSAYQKKASCREQACVKTMIVYTLFEVIVYTFYRSNRFPSILGSPWIK